MYELRLVTPPTGEPLDLREAKRALRRFDDDEDDEIRDLVKAARAYVEGYGVQLLTATYDLWLPYFRTTIDIPKPPLQSISSVSYYDLNGVLQTVGPTVWQAHASSGSFPRRGRVTLADNQVWPVTAGRLDAVRIRFVAGYGDRTAVPADLKQAMRLLIGHWYRHGSAVVSGTIAAELPLGVRSILARLPGRDEQM